MTSSNASWAFYQDDSEHAWHRVFVKDTEEARDVVQDYVRSGFKVTIDARSVHRLDLDDDVFACGVITVEPNQETTAVDESGRELPVVWLLFEPTARTNQAGYVDCFSWGEA